MSRTVTINLPSRGEKECKQVINIRDDVEESVIPSLVKQLAGRDIMLRGKDYFINTF